MDAMTLRSILLVVKCLLANQTLSSLILIFLLTSYELPAAVRKFTVNKKEPAIGFVSPWPWLQIFSFPVILTHIFKFISSQVQRMREQSAAQISSAAMAAARAKKTQQERAKARKEKKELKDDDEDELPEVDQDTNKSLRQRVK